MAKGRDNEPIFNQSYVEANELVVAKYHSTLLENQVMAVALTRLETVYDKDGTEKLEAILYPGELKQLIGDPSNIYKELKAISKTITGHTMFLEDGKGNFKAFSVVPNADYKDGIFKIKFNEEIKNYIYGLEGNFTTFELGVMTSFKNNSAFRLYQVLKKDLYKYNARKKPVELEYNVSELKFLMGLADADEPSVKNEMSRMGNHIDWDVLYSLLPADKRKYERWDAFRKFVIMKAQEELKDKSDIRFEFEPIKKGKATNSILFRIYENKPVNIDDIEKKQKIIEGTNSEKTYKQIEFPRMYHEDFYRTYVGHNNLSEEDIDALMIKANWDEDIVERAITAADKQEHVESYVGWIYRFIERGGYEQIEVLKGSAEEAQKVRKVLDNFEEHKDDIALRMINKAKENEPELFDGFINTLPIPDFDLAIDALGAEELCQRYILYKKNNK